MKPFPIFTVLLVLVITLVVFVPHFPHLIGAAAAGLGVTADQALAAFVVAMLIAAILLSVLAVREICGLVRCQVAWEKRLGRT
ncbi:MAG: hypothetical protein PHP59_07215 [Methanofollis sp.]|uniref:hypothetical protein n=1 Tax=Methanofollis sp. TaxID=2052835 RepID=UPI0026144943|nr:hypothetical protein [Methanofollis sp.]MDD4255152.1 hypothetical protein [Methanofollis sp.]